MKAILVLIGLGIFATICDAALVKESVPYEHEGAQLEGYLVYDDATKEKRPGVLVVHEWWGLNDYAKMRADRLAEMGYVAFALDMYGKGKATTNREEAGKLAGQFRGKPLIRTRAKAGFEVLADHERVDRDKIAAIGFCFGGTTVLELALSGEDLNGVVSFHGGLPEVKLEDARNLKAKVLVAHGADDPFISEEAIEGFQSTMRESGADWQFINYGNAVHAFTNPNAGADKSSGVAYEEKAAERSWKHMQVFFEEIFGSE